jgi:hypothetical protein
VPELAEDRYAPALLLYLQAVARAQLAHRELTATARLSPRLLEAATSAARLAWQLGAELGLSPGGHARLKLLMADVAGAEVSVAELAARGREIRERRQAEFAQERGLSAPVSAAGDEAAQEEGESTDACEDLPAAEREAGATREPRDPRALAIGFSHHRDEEPEP